MIKALLVDDELHNLQNLEFLLTNDCEGVNIAGKCQSATEAREWLQHNSADVVFLDIQMPGENGFQFLSSLASRNFQVVFVTAHNEHALQAIKASALDYLVKPVNISELQSTVEKVRLAINNSSEQQRQLLEHLLQTAGKGSYPKKIALPQLGSISFVDVADIVALQADSNYTILHLSNMQKMVISKTLKEFEEILDAEQFVRIHKSHMINFRYIREYNTADGGSVKMTDGNQWSISRRQLDLFLEKMRSASLTFGNK